MSIAESGRPGERTSHKHHATRPSKLEAALDMARKGFPVFPIIANGKTPAVKGWQDLATTNPERIAEMWADNPEYNIGILTRDLVVVDVDPRNGGLDTLAALQLNDAMPQTLVVRTQGGGHHLYYRKSNDDLVRGGANKLGPGVDIKSYGGYVVAPGSTVDGRSYTWQNERPVAVCPDWIVAECKKAKARGPDAGKRLVPEDDTAVAMAQARLDRAPDAPEGGRDNAAYKMAASFYDCGVSYDTAHELLTEWNYLRAFPPMEPGDIARIARSAGINRDNAIGSRHPDAPGFEPVEVAPRANVIPFPGIVDTPNKPDKFRSIPAATLAAQALTVTGQPLIRGLFDRVSTIALYGPSGGGKTFCAMDIGYHIHRGLEWCGKPVHQGGVLHLAAEGGYGINKRLRALEMKYGPYDPTRYHVLPRRADLLRGGDANSLYAEVQRLELLHGHKIELFIVDTLSRVMPGGDENGPQDMTSVVAKLDSLREAAKLAVLMVHHTGKDEKKGMRGHSSLLAAVDTEILCDKHVFAIKKKRDMEGGWGMRFGLDRVRIGCNANGEEITSCTVNFLAAARGEQKSAPMPLTREDKDHLAAIETRWRKENESDLSQIYIRPFTTNFALKAVGIENDQGDGGRSMVRRILGRMVASGYVGESPENGWLLMPVATGRKVVD